MIHASPSVSAAGKRRRCQISGSPLLEVDNLRTEFRSGGSVFAAVDGVSFTLMPGETLGSSANRAAARR